MVNTAMKTRRMVTLAIFTAIIIVLQLLSNVLKVGAVSITLTLVPIVVGAALYHIGAGAYLGGVFGAVVLVGCITGMDAGGAMLWNANPFLTAAICLVKGIAAGVCAGLVYRAIAGGGRHQTLGAICAGIVCPLVNTGIFCLGMVFFFHDILVAWAGGSELVYYIVFGMTGINFVLELAINLVLAPVVVRIIQSKQPK